MISLLRIAFVSFIFSAASVAYAGTISLQGTLRMTAEVSDGSVKLVGGYDLLNVGNEPAIGAFPEIEIAGWNWRGSPKLIAAQGKSSWDFEGAFPVSMLECYRPGQCVAGRPTQGYLPVYITRRFQDPNGYRFSSADVAGIEIVERTSKDPFRGTVQPRLRLSGDGQRFQGSLAVTNLSNEEQQLRIFSFGPEELKISVAQSELAVAPRGKGEISFSAENATASHGSNSTVYTVLVSDRGGYQSFAVASENLQIRIHAPWKHLEKSISIVVGISVLLLYLFVFRDREKRQSKSS